MSSTELVLPSSSPQTAMAYQNSSSASISILLGIASCAFLVSFFQVPSRETCEKESGSLPSESTVENQELTC